MKASKRLIGAIVALVAALAVSVGSTFAWFTEQNTAKVNAFDVTVRDATGSLLIGLTADTVSPAPVNVNGSGAGQVDLTSKKLNDLTVAEDIESEFSLVNEKKVVANATDYVKFTLYFEATDDVDVYMVESSAISCEADTSNDIKADSYIQTNATGYGKSVETTIATDASNAARVAFVEDGKSSAPIYWAPNETSTGFYQGNLAADYASYLEKGVWPGQDGGDSKAAASKITNAVTTASTSQTSKESSTLICTLTGGPDAPYKGHVDVWIWLEGTDGDCLNSIFKDKLSINLDFIGLPESAPGIGG